MVKKSDEKLTRAQYQAKKKRRHFWRPFAVSKAKKNKQVEPERDPVIILTEDEQEVSQTAAPLSREEKIQLVKRRLNIAIGVTALLLVVVLLVLFLVK